jgi:hypothetical protein
MSRQQRFLISYIQDNQPASIEVLSDADTLSPDDAREYVTASLKSPVPARITDIQVVSIHHPPNPDVHPGHYQQPEG